MRFRVTSSYDDGGLCHQYDVQCSFCERFLNAFPHELHAIVERHEAECRRQGHQRSERRAPLPRAAFEFEGPSTLGTSSARSGKRYFVRCRRP